MQPQDPLVPSQPIPGEPIPGGAPPSPVGGMAPAPQILGPSVPPPAPVAPVAPVVPPMPGAAPSPLGVPGSAPQPMPMPSVPAQPIFPTGSGISSAKGGSKKKLFVGLAVGLVVVLLVAGGLFAASKFLGGVKLKEFSNDDFSISYPDGYEVEEKAGGTTEFTEPDSPEETQSGVIVGVNDLPSSFGEDERKEVFKEIEDQFGDLDTFATSSQQVKDVQKDIVQFEGADALKVTATVEKDGKKFGEVTLLAGLTQDKLYTMIVYAHVSDAGVMKKAGAIIDSFDLK